MLTNAKNWSPMKVLITYATERLPARLAHDLATSHDICLTDRHAEPRMPDLVVSTLGHDSETDDLVRGMDAIVHWGGTNPGVDASDRLDRAMYCTYNLLRSASDEGVSRVVFLSSLDLLKKYPDHYTVTEQWRPKPTSDMSGLSYHLGEYVCREFAHEQRLSVVCLRLGDLVWNGKAASSSSLLIQDAVQAVQLALTSKADEDSRWTLLPDPFGWHVYHIQSDVPDARFATAAARTKMGFEPLTAKASR